MVQCRGCFSTLTRTLTHVQTEYFPRNANTTISGLSSCYLCWLTDILYRHFPYSFDFSLTQFCSIDRDTISYFSGSFPAHPLGQYTPWSLWKQGKYVQHFLLVIGDKAIWYPFLFSPSSLLFNNKDSPPYGSPLDKWSLRSKTVTTCWAHLEESVLNCSQIRLNCTNRSNHRLTS